MLEKILKYAFGLTGALTGMTLVRLLMIRNGMEEHLTTIYGVGVIVFTSLILGVLMYFLGGKIITLTAESVDKVETIIQKITLYELLSGAGALF